MRIDRFIAKSLFPGVEPSAAVDQVVVLANGDRSGKAVVLWAPCKAGQVSYVLSDPVAYDYLAWIHFHPSGLPYREPNKNLHSLYEIHIAIYLCRLAENVVEAKDRFFLKRLPNIRIVH